jgi:hypothetical protein
VPCELLELSAAVPVAFLDPGRRLPLVALVLQWRQDYPNNRPPTRATAISEMGHEPPPAMQKKIGVYRPGWTGIRCALRNQNGTLTHGRVD